MSSRFDITASIFMVAGTNAQKGGELRTSADVSTAVFFFEALPYENASWPCGRSSPPTTAYPRII